MREEYAAERPAEVFDRENGSEKMKRPAKDKRREERIQMEIIVDAYGPGEQLTGWLCYLEEHLHVPFAARCIAGHATSPLQVGESVEVRGWHRRKIASRICA